MQATWLGQQRDLLAGFNGGVRINTGYDRLVTTDAGDDMRLGTERLDDLDGCPDRIVAFLDVGVTLQAEVLRPDSQVHLLAFGGAELARELFVSQYVERGRDDAAVPYFTAHEVHDGVSDDTLSAPRGWCL